MKTVKKVKKATVKVVDKTLEYPERLTELEAEIRAYPTRVDDDTRLKSIQSATEANVAGETVIQFSFKNNTYAAGHADITFAGSNHARGLRHISFHAGGKIVLYIEGNFENQQFGSNFQFHQREIYTPGEWEADFIELTDELRERNAKRREAFRMKRLKEKPKYS